MIESPLLMTGLYFFSLKRSVEERISEMEEKTREIKRNGEILRPPL